MPLVGFHVPWCVGAPPHGPHHHSRVRVMGCCLCLQVLVVVHGCPWAVIAICALFEVVDGGGIHLLGDIALPSFLLWWLWVTDVCDGNY